MSRLRASIAVGAVAVVLVFAAVLVAGNATAGAKGNPASTGVLGPDDVTIHLTIQHSRFIADAPEALRVRPGTTVRFVIDNRDPIGHEFIIGDDGDHRRHEAGTEAVHEARPGEVSVGALASAETVFTFIGSTGAGDVQYACHLPGHLRYGMSGTIEVVPA